jgi:hypothetical protein
MHVSLFASSIRPHLWPAFFESSKGTSVDVEVVFGGNLTEDQVFQACKMDPFRYIHTADIKPAQVYEVCRRECKGELICWVADDAEFPDDVIGKAYRFWKENCGRKDVVCIRTKENYGTWRDCDNTCHHFFANSPEAPKMAPIGMMNREYFDELGGIDRRYICGQWDNDLMMRIYNDGGKLHYFGDGWVELDHLNKHDPDFGISMKRPFGNGYAHDRRILEASWGKKGQMAYRMPYRRFDTGFEPYDDKDLASKSQSFTLEGVFND